MKKTKYFNLIALAFCTAAHAGEVENKIISETVAAYGGQQVIDMKSLTLLDRYKQFAYGQSATPNTVEVRNKSILLEIDYTNNHRSFQHWETNHSGPYFVQRVHKNNARHNIDHLQRTILNETSNSTSSLGTPFLRMLDTAIAKTLHENRETAAYEGKKKYLGETYDVIRTKMSGSSDLTLYIDEKTKLISRITRNSSRSGLLDYVFSDYQQKDGFIYASDTSFVVGKNIFSVTIDREVEFNSLSPSAFNLPKNYLQVEAQDNAEMKAFEVSKNVFFAGQGGAFSVFVDAGDHFIEAGGYSGITDRLTAVHRLTKTQKPLRKIIVQHHHGDHLGAIKEASQLGASFVTVKNNIPVIREKADEQLPDERFDLVSQKSIIGNGSIELYEVETPHAEQYLIVYIPSAKTVFSADHFYTPFKKKLPFATLNTMGLRKAIGKLGLEVDLFLDAHNSRVLTWADFLQVTNDYKTPKCKNGYRICNH